MYLSSVASRKAMWKTSLFQPQPSKIAMWVFTILASSSSLHTQFEAAVGCRFDLPFFERKKQLFFLLPKYSLVVLNILQYYYHHSRRLKRRLWKFSVVNSTLLHPKALVVVVRAASSKKEKPTENGETRAMRAHEKLWASAAVYTNSSHGYFYFFQFSWLQRLNSVTHERY